MNKYHAKRTEYAGQVYDSKAEASFAQLLDLWMRAGKIKSWYRGETQVLFDGGSRKRRISYRPDFIVIFPDLKSYAYDVKGAVPRDFRLRAILWEQKFPALPLRVVDKYGNVTWNLD